MTHEEINQWLEGERISLRTLQVFAAAHQFADARHSAVISSLEILYGLAIEGTGIAGTILDRNKLNCGVIFPEGDISDRYHQVVSREYNIDLEDRLIFFRSVSWSDDAIEVLMMAKYLVEAMSSGEGGYMCMRYLGTEHCLLALLLIPKSCGGSLLLRELSSLGINVDTLCEEVCECREHNFHVVHKTLVSRGILT